MRKILKQYKALLAVLPKSANRFLNFYSISLGILSVIDALSLGLLAMFISPLMLGGTLELPLIGVLDQVGLLIGLGVLSFVIILKSFISLLLTWVATRSLAKYEVILGKELISSFLRAPWDLKITKNTAETVRTADLGVSNSVTNFLLPISTIQGEVLSFLSIMLVLIVSQPLVALITVAYLSSIAFILFIVVNKHVRAAGETTYKFSIATSVLLTETIDAIKEISLRSKTEEVERTIEYQRKRTAVARSNNYFLSLVPRYVLDAAIIGGFILVGLLGFLFGGPEQAMYSIALFALAGFRMAPSLTRFQSVINQANVVSPIIEVTIKEISEAKIRSNLLAKSDQAVLSGDLKTLIFENVSYSYPNVEENAVKNVSLELQLQKKIAFVGPSGAGKSTIVDLLIGVLDPKSGRIKINGTNLLDVKTQWSKQIGYLPQSVALFDSTIAHNVSFEWDKSMIDEQKVHKALKNAQLNKFIEDSPEGIWSKTGDKGISLSGGQRQRLGLARVFYQNPNLLVLDESTSALDTKTEALISNSIERLSKDKTIIVVAHRLSTIKDFDQIIYLDKGKVLSQGNFNELVQQVPAFAEQAKLAGII